MIYSSRYTAVLLTLVLALCQSTVAQDSSQSIISNQKNGIDSTATIDAWYDDEFLDVEQAFQLQPRLEDNNLILHWEIAEGYYLYSHQLKLQIELEGALSEVALELPFGEAKHDEFFGDVEVYYHQLIASAAVPDHTAVKFSIRSQGCADAGLCYPPHTQHFKLNTTTSLFEEVPRGVGSNKSATNNAGLSDEKTADTSLLLMLLFAFLGGAILNLMPCVFPILALKILGLVNANTISRADRRNHGFSYTLGVVFCFVAIASLLLVLRSLGESLGWGFQLQTPWVVATLVYLFLVVGQSMSGYVEFNPSWANAGQGLTERGGNVGSFFTGMLAVIVASPCTAPFMGAALGFALVQPTYTALSIFMALGLGMAAPFLLLVTIPSLAKVLPKPGAWMLTFKEVMAFPLYLTAVWLLWVLGRQTNVNGMAMVAAGCVLIFFALWLWRRQTSVSKSSALMAVAVAIGLLFGPWMAISDEAEASDTPINAYSSARVTEFRSQGKPVFVNVTADWCITCLVNERVALSRTSVLEGFTENNIAYLKADWTNSDPKITQLLSEYGRSGVPLYLLFPADSSKPAIVLPQILTPEIVLNAFKVL